ncbi:MAG: hypothetical protein KY455_05795 [Euryarchaeota archaeon]|nr:hypothetical protein [Euryarchaeota archaeon]
MRAQGVWKGSSAIFLSLVLVGLFAPAGLAGCHPACSSGVDPILNGDFEAYARVDVEVAGHSDGAGGALFWTSTARSIDYASNARFVDSGVDGDTDREVVIPGDPAGGDHNFWQSYPTLQWASLDASAFAYTIENGTVAPSANNQLGFSLSPEYDQHPWVGIFWEGAVHFTADDILANIDADGRVSLDPAVDGSIICPDWDPCRSFRENFTAADTDGRRALLGETRLVQVSFWNFNRQEGQVVIDDVALEGAQTFL